MNWIKDNWEKAILLLVSLIVIVTAVMFVKRSLSFKDDFEFSKTSAQNDLPTTELPKVNTAISLVDQVAPWENPVRGGAAAKKVPLFVSIPIVEVEGKMIDMLDPAAPKIREPVTNLWLRDNGLDFTRSTILSEDQDRDNFSNIEEWEAKTSPIDPDAHPPYGTKLVMVARRQQNYVVEFASKPGENSYQINRKASTSYPRATFIKGLGELTDDGKLKLESYEKAEGVDRNGIRVDASKLTVTYVESGEPHALVAKTETIIPTYFLEIAYKLGEMDKKFYKLGEQIVLPNDPDTQYKVVDIQEKSATITFLDSAGSEKEIVISTQN